MATNQVYNHGDQFALTVGAGVKSGEPGVVGDLPYVALTDSDAAGVATVKTNGVYMLAVKGHDGSQNAAVAVGQAVYYDSGELNVDSSAQRYGYALAAVASGATTTIPVKIGY